MMSRREVTDLLTLIAAYDRRTVGQADVYTWSDVATRERWQNADALEAVKAHHAESTEWIKPAHVTQRLRARRSAPPQAHELAGGTDTADPEHIQRIMDWFREHQRSAPRTADVLTVACPFCGVDAGHRCVQTRLGMPQHNPPRPIEQPHVQRRRALRDSTEDE